MGFNPYNRIRRARMTRTGDIAYVAVFVAIVAAAVLWAVS